VIIAALLLGLLPFLKGRLPHHVAVSRLQSRVGFWRGNYSWLKHPVFMAVMAVNTTQGLAYFIPIIWLPSECVLHFSSYVLWFYLNASLCKYNEYRHHEISLDNCHVKRQVPAISPTLSSQRCPGSSIIGRLGMGYMSDKVDPWFLGIATLALTSLATFVLWGIVSHSLNGLLAFAIAYGILAGGWTSLWTGLSRPIVSMFLFPYGSSTMR
jgi:MFS transporter, MCT family, solute carrier family 16 (monocarboxylic acid transporters), member 10